MNRWSLKPATVAEVKPHMCMCTYMLTRPPLRICNAYIRVRGKAEHAKNLLPSIGRQLVPSQLGWAGPTYPIFVQAPYRVAYLDLLNPYLAWNPRTLPQH